MSKLQLFKIWKSLLWLYSLAFWLWPVLLKDFCSKIKIILYLYLDTIIDFEGTCNFTFCNTNPKHYSIPSPLLYSKLYWLTVFSSCSLDNSFIQCSSTFIYQNYCQEIGFLFIFFIQLTLFSLWCLHKSGSLI